MFVPELKSIPCSGNRVKSQMHWRFQTLGTPAARMQFVEKTLERDVFLYFCNNRSTAKTAPLLVTRLAERFSALGGEPGLEILRLLLAAHPTGMVAGEVQRSEER